MLKRRITALLTGVVFLFNQGWLPAQGWAQTTQLLEVPLGIQSSFQIEIPSELGTVNQLISGNGPAVVHIQEAHGRYEVQKNIEGILKELEKQFGIRQILLEGDAFQLNPLLVRFFPNDKKKTREIAENLAKNLWLTGPELFFLDHNAEAQGIEDLNLYNQNAADFVRVLKARSASRQFLDKAEIQIERLTSPYLNKDLRTFLKRAELFSLGQIPFEVWTEELLKAGEKKLKIEFGNPLSQIDWPMFLRLKVLKELEGKFEQAAFEKERSRFLAGVKRFSGGARGVEIEKVTRLLSRPLSQSQPPSPDTPLVFERMVSALPSNFNYELFPNVNRLIGYLILQSELDPSRLLWEMNTLENQVIEKLTRNEKEKQIAALLRDLSLLKKLFALELTPEEFEGIVGSEVALAALRPRNDDEITNSEKGVFARRPTADEAIRSSLIRFRPSALIKEFELIQSENNRVQNQKFEHLEEMDALFNAALGFYKSAKARDAKMIENAARFLKTEDGGQGTENRGQRAADKEQKSEDGREKTQGKSEKLEEKSRIAKSEKKMTDKVFSDFRQLSSDARNPGVTVIITGGFHSEPFKNHFASRGFNYALITPRMTEITSQDAYNKRMIETYRKIPAAVHAAHRLPDLGATPSANRGAYSVAWNSFDAALQAAGVVRSEIRVQAAGSQPKPASPYGAEANHTRGFSLLDVVYGLSADLEAAAKEPKRMLLIGAGRGVAAAEMGVRFPNLKITAVNKEAGVWSPEVAGEGMLRKAFSEASVQEALNKIQDVVLDVEDSSKWREILGDDPFDYIVIEGAVAMYLKDKIRVIENLFNRYLSGNGIIAFELDQMIADDFTPPLTGSQRARQIVKEAFSGRAELLKDYSDQYFKYRKHTDAETLQIPLVLSEAFEIKDLIYLGIPTPSHLSVYKAVFAAEMPDSIRRSEARKKEAPKKTAVKKSAEEKLGAQIRKFRELSGLNLEDAGVALQPAAGILRPLTVSEIQKIEDGKLKRLDNDLFTTDSYELLKDQFELIVSLLREIKDPKKSKVRKRNEKGIESLRDLLSEHDLDEEHYRKLGISKGYIQLVLDRKIPYLDLWDDILTSETAKSLLRETAVSNRKKVLSAAAAESSEAPPLAPVPIPAEIFGLQNLAAHTVSSVPTLNELLGSAGAKKQEERKVNEVFQKALGNLQGLIQFYTAASQRTYLGFENVPFKKFQTALRAVASKLKEVESLPEDFNQKAAVISHLIEQLSEFENLTLNTRAVHDLTVDLSAKWELVKDAARSEMRLSEEGDRARALADPLTGKYSIQRFGAESLTEEQRENAVELMYFDPQPLLQDLKRLSPGVRDYARTINALRFMSGTLLNYWAVRLFVQELNPQRQKNAEVIRDLGDVLRDYQYDLLVLPDAGDGQYKHINRRTWAGRLDASYEILDPIIAEELNSKNEVVLGDFAVSDGIIARDIANHYLEKNQRVKVVAYDLVLYLYVYQDEGVLYFFDPYGRVLERIGDEGVKRQFSAREAAGAAAVFQKLEAIPEARREKHVLSLIHPSAQAFALEYPDLLEFRTQDVFQSNPQTHDVIRVSGLLMPGRYSYFSPEKIRAALTRLGQTLNPGGRLLNGTFWAVPGKQYQLFQKTQDGGRLALVDVYPQKDRSQEEGFQSIDLPVRSEMRGHISGHDQAVNKTFAVVQKLRKAFEEIYRSGENLSLNQVLARDEFTGVPQSIVEALLRQSGFKEAPILTETGPIYLNPTREGVSSITVTVEGERYLNERPVFESLVNQSSFLPQTLSRLYGEETGAMPVRKIILKNLSEAGLYRNVFLAEVEFSDPSKKIPPFVVKISRRPLSDWSTLLHDAQNLWINRVLGNPSGGVWILQDGRGVISGPYYPGRVFEEFKSDEEAQKAVVSELISVWRNSGKIFVKDVHRNQFKVTFDRSGQTEARLIDKGNAAVRQDKRINLRYEVNAKREVSFLLEGGEISDLPQWLQTATPHVILWNLIDDLEAPVPLKPGERQTLDPDSEMINDGRNDFALFPRAIISGVVEALGEEESTDFFREFFSDTRRRNDERFAQLQTALKRYFPGIEAKVSQPRSENRRHHFSESVDEEIANILEGLRDRNSAVVVEAIKDIKSWNLSGDLTREQSSQIRLALVREMLNGNRKLTGEFQAALYDWQVREDEFGVSVDLQISQQSQNNRWEDARKLISVLKEGYSSIDKNEQRWRVKADVLSVVTLVDGLGANVQTQAIKKMAAVKGLEKDEDYRSVMIPWLNAIAAANAEGDSNGEVTGLKREAQKELQRLTRSETREVAAWLDDPMDSEYKEALDRLILAVAITDHGGPLGLLLIGAIITGRFERAINKIKKVGDKNSNEIDALENAFKNLAGATSFIRLGLTRLRVIEEGAKPTIQELRTMTSDYFALIKAYREALDLLLKEAKPYSRELKEYSLDPERFGYFFDELPNHQVRTLGILEAFLSGDMKAVPLNLKEWFHSQEIKWQTKQDAEAVPAVEIEPDIPTINADPQALHLSIERVFSNILKSYLAESRIGAAETAEIPVRVRFDWESQEVKIEIENRGQIPSEKLKTIFQLDYHRKEFSHGVAMPFSARLVSLMGGRISINNLPDKKVQTVIAFPAYFAPNSRSQELAVSQPSAVGGGRSENRENKPTIGMKQTSSTKPVNGMPEGQPAPLTLKDVRGSVRIFAEGIRKAFPRTREMQEIKSRLHLLSAINTTGAGAAELKGALRAINEMFQQQGDMPRQVETALWRLRRQIASLNIEGKNLLREDAEMLVENLFSEFAKVVKAKVQDLKAGKQDSVSPDYADYEPQLREKLPEFWAAFTEKNYWRAEPLAHLMRTGIRDGGNTAEKLRFLLGKIETRLNLLVIQEQQKRSEMRIPIPADEALADLNTKFWESLGENTRYLAVSGAALVGKDTLLKKIQEELNVDSEETGKKYEILDLNYWLSVLKRQLTDPGKVPADQRQALKKLEDALDSTLKNEIKTNGYTRNGQVVAVLNAVLKLDVFKNAYGILFNGFPSNAELVEAVENGQLQLASGEALKIDLFTVLDLSEEKSLERWKSVNSSKAATPQEVEKARQRIAKTEKDSAQLGAKFESLDIPWIKVSTDTPGTNVFEKEELAIKRWGGAVRVWLDEKAFQKMISDSLRLIQDNQDALLRKIEKLSEGTPEEERQGLQNAADKLGAVFEDLVQLGRGKMKRSNTSHLPFTYDAQSETVYFPEPGDKAADSHNVARKLILTAYFRRAVEEKKLAENTQRFSSQELNLMMANASPLAEKEIFAFTYRVEESGRKVTLGLAPETKIEKTRDLFEEAMADLLADDPEMTRQRARLEEEARENRLRDIKSGKAEPEVIHLSRLRRALKNKAIHLKNLKDLKKEWIQYAEDFNKAFRIQHADTRKNLLKELMADLINLHAEAYKTKLDLSKSSMDSTRLQELSALIVESVAAYFNGLVPGREGKVVGKSEVVEAVREIEPDTEIVSYARDVNFIQSIAKGITQAPVSSKLAEQSASEAAKAAGGPEAAALSNAIAALASSKKEDGAAGESPLLLGNSGTQRPAGGALSLVTSSASPSVGVTVQTADLTMPGYSADAFVRKHEIPQGTLLQDLIGIFKTDNNLSLSNLPEKLPQSSWLHKFKSFLKAAEDGSLNPDLPDWLAYLYYLYSFKVKDFKKTIAGEWAAFSKGVKALNDDSLKEYQKQIELAKRVKLELADLRAILFMTVLLDAAAAKQQNPSQALDQIDAALQKIVSEKNYAFFSYVRFMLSLFSQKRREKKEAGVKAEPVAESVTPTAEKPSPASAEADTGSEGKK